MHRHKHLAPRGDLDRLTPADLADVARLGVQDGGERGAATPRCASQGLDLASLVALTLLAA